MKLFRLYRYYGVDDVLLYIGISANFARRNTTHACSSIWFSSCVKVTLDHCKNEDEMKEMEKLAIENEKPLHNIRHNKIEKIKIGNSHKKRSYVSTKEHLYVIGMLKKASKFNEVSYQTKISIPTLYSIRKPESKPHASTVEVLYKYFQEVGK